MSLTLIEPVTPTPVKRHPVLFPRPIHPYRPEPHAVVEMIEPGSLAEESGIKRGTTDDSTALSKWSSHNLCG